MLTAVRGYRQYHKRQFEQAAALLPAIQMPGRPLGMLEREFGICHTALQIELRPCGGDAVLHSLDRIDRLLKLAKIAWSRRYGLTAGHVLSVFAIVFSGMHPRTAAPTILVGPLVGGWGEMKNRSCDPIERDQRDGFVTLAQAQTDSGYSA
jgi:hypothetical protein